ncbi:MAG: 5'/3'-nucleotidase SurE [Actinomycetota bacterium]
MRILVTNDDGIDSVGLHVLARAMRQFGEVVVAAPDQEYSGAGAAIGALHIMKPEVHRRTVEGIDTAWAISGPPALCVFLSRFGLYGAPFDLVVSGINPGANVGRSVYHSGTVGAAVTARNAGITGIAVSQAVTGFGVEGQGWDDAVKGQLWESAAEVAAAVTGAWIAERTPEPVVINVNVPNMPVPEMRGWRRTTVGMQVPRAVVTADLVAKEGYADSYTVELSYGDPVPLPAHTDGGAVENGEVSITYLSRFDDVADHGTDLIHAALDGLVGGMNTLRS